MQTFWVDEAPTKFMTYSINPKGILLTGKSDSPPLGRNVPGTLARYLSSDEYASHL